MSHGIPTSVPIAKEQEACWMGGRHRGDPPKSVWFSVPGRRPSSRFPPLCRPCRHHCDHHDPGSRKTVPFSLPETTTLEATHGMSLPQAQLPSKASLVFRDPQLTSPLHASLATLPGTPQVTLSYGTASRGCARSQVQGSLVAEKGLEGRSHLGSSCL